MKKFRKNAGVILKCRNEVLLCKRSPDKSLPNIWSIPSGGIENDESPGYAAIREFYEETNIELNINLDFIGFIDIFSEEKIKKGIMFVFLQETKNKKEPNLNKASDGQEHTECKYFKKENIPNQKENKQLLDILTKIFE